MSLEFTQELCVKTPKKDGKSAEKLTRPFKIDLRNFTNFGPSTQKYEKFTL